MDRPSNASGDLKDIRCGRFGIRDDDAAVRPEHDETVRHGVERAVEPLRYAVRVLLLADRGKQDGPHEMRHLVDGEHHRNDEHAEHEVVDVALQHQPESDRPKHRERQDRHHLARAEVAAGDGDGAGEQRRDRGDLAEHVGHPVQGDEGEQAGAQSLDRAGDDVVALAANRFGVADDARRVDLAHRVVAPQARCDHQQGQDQVDQFLGFPVDEQADDAMAEGAEKQNPRPVVQRANEADIDVFRYVVGFGCFHYLRATRTADMPYSP